MGCSTYHTGIITGCGIWPYLSDSLAPLGWCVACELSGVHIVPKCGVYVKGLHITSRDSGFG